MKESLAGNRYAKSLIGLSIEKKELDTVYNDMVLISETVENSKDLDLLLKSPVVKTDKKQEILSSIFGKETSELTKQFLLLISSRNREAIIGDIAGAFVRQYKVIKKIIVTEVTSAIKLESAQKKKILQLLNTNESSSVEVIEKINPEIIGGFIVRVDDKQIDASISRKLDDLKQGFSKNPYIADF
jgi:F-type H+-transporting ATPase subunit delta